MTGRGCYHIDLRVYFGEVLLQNDHSKNGSSGRHVSGSDADAVCCCHTCSGISLRRAERNACFQISGHVEKCGTFFCQNTGIVTRGQNVRQNIECFPWICFVCDCLVKFGDHVGKVSVGFRIDWKDSRCLADTNDTLAGHFPLNVSGKGCHIVDICHMRLTV